MTNSISLPKMRTCDGLYNEIRKLDPGSQVSKHFIYKLMLSGKIKTIMVGKKRLADLNEVLDYLRNPRKEHKEPTLLEYGKLRKIQA